MILDDLFFSQKKEDIRNPNDPADRPFFNAKRDIENKAFKAWVEEFGGGVLLRGMQQNLIAKIKSLIVKDTTTIEGILDMLELKKEISRDLVFIDRIEKAFEEEDKRQELLKN